MVFITLAVILAGVVFPVGVTAVYIYQARIAETFCYLLGYHRIALLIRYHRWLMNFVQDLHFVRRFVPNRIRNAEPGTYIESITTNLRERPFRVIYRLAPAVYAIVKALRTEKDRKKNFFAACHQVSSYLVDQMPGTDMELLTRFSRDCSDRAVLIYAFLEERFFHNDQEERGHENIASPTLEQGVKLIVFIISVFGGAIPATASSFKSFSAIIESSAKNIKNTSMVMDELDKYLHGDEVTQELAAVTAQTEDAIENFRAASFGDKVESFDKMKKNLIDFRKTHDRVSRAVGKNYSSRAAVSRLGSKIAKLEDLLTAMGEAMDYRASIRPHPVCRNFVGLPGAGKTTWVRETLVPALMERTGLHEKWPGASPIYTYNPASDHMPGYTNQPVFLCDEFLARQVEDPILNSFNALATDQTTLIDGADLAFKNMRPVHRFLLSCSNFTRLTPPANNNIQAFTQAFNSRLNNVYIHFPGYNDKKPRDEQGARTLCFHKVGTNDFQMPDQHHVCPGGRNAKKITEEEIINACVADFLRHDAVYRERLRKHDESVARANHEAARYIVVEPSTAMVGTIQKEVRNLIGACHPGGIFFVPEDSVIPEAANGDSLILLDRHHPLSLHHADDLDQVPVLTSLADIEDFCQTLGYSLEPDIYRAPGHGVKSIVLYGTSAEEIINCIRADGNEVSAELSRVIRFVFSPDRDYAPAVTRSMIYGILRSYHARDSDYVYFADQGLSMTRDEDRILYHLKPSALARIIRHGPKKGLEAAAWAAHSTSDHVRSKFRKGVRGTAMWLSQHPFANFIVTWFVIWGASATVAFMVNKLSKLFEGASDPFEADTGPEEKSDKDPTDNERLIATILSQYDMTSDGPVKSRHEGWIYDEMSRKWIRVPDSLVRGAVRERGVTDWYDEQANWRSPQADEPGMDLYGSESMDAFGKPSINARRKRQLPTPPPQGQYESGTLNVFKDVQTVPGEEVATVENNPTLRELLDRHINGSQVTGQGQALLNEVVLRDFKKTTALDSVIRTLTTARVAVVQDGRAVLGIAVRGAYIVTTAHVYQPGKPILVRRMGHKDKWYSAEVVTSLPSSDFLFLKVVEKTYPAARDITAFFATARDLEKESAGGLLLPQGETGAVLHTGRITWDLRNRYGDLGLVTENIIRLHWPTSFKPTAPGFCGSPLMIMSARRGASIIAGMHSYADGVAKFSGCVLVTQEMIERAIAADHEMQLQAPQRQILEGKEVAVEVANFFSAEKKSENPFPENDRITHVGHFPTAFIQRNNTTEFTEQEVTFNNPPKKVPAIQPWSSFSPETRKRWTRGPFNRPDRGYTQLAKMAIREKSFSPQVEEALTRGVTQLYMDLADDGEIRPLTNFEVVNGVASGPLSSIKGLDMSKSVGFTLKKLYNIKKKGDMFTFDGVYKPRDIPATAYLYSYVKHVRDGAEPLWWPTTATLKDELLPREKVLGEGKIRVFSNVDFMQFFLDKAYFGWCVSFAKNHFGEFPGTVGMDPLVDFGSLYRDLAEHPNIFTGDYKGWDKTLPRSVMLIGTKVLANVIDAHFTEADAKAAKSILPQIVDRLEVYDGNLMNIKGSIASGIWLTNFFNSLCNHILRWGCIMTEILEKTGELREIPDILLHTVSRDHGDDMITSVSNEWKDYVNYFTMKSQCARLGMTLTPAAKDGKESAFEETSETSFVSRYPRKVFGRIVGALKKESIEQQLDYTRLRTESEVQALFNGLLLEAYPWGRDYFEKIRRGAVINLKAKGFASTQLPNYEQAEVEILHRLGAARCVTTGGANDIYVDTSDIYQTEEGNHESGSDPINAHTTAAENKMNLYIEIGGQPPQPFDQRTFADAVRHFAKTKVKSDLTFRDAEGKRITEAPTTGEIRAVTEKIDLWLDCTTHVEDTNDHRRKVNSVGRDLLGKSYPNHDLSKFSDAERLGYQLMMFSGIKGDLWEHALWHHYFVNDHHPEFFLRKGWAEFWKNNSSKPADYPPDIVQKIDLDEMLVDAVACTMRFHPQESFKERLAGILSDYARGYKEDIWPASLLEALQERAKKILGMQAESTELKVRTWEADGITYTDFRKYFNFLRNSKQVTQCPECLEDGTHAPNCEINKIYRCGHCVYRNASASKMKNHIMSAHYQKPIIVSESYGSHEAGREQSLMTAVPAEAPAAPMLQPLMDDTNGNVFRTSVAAQGTVPSMASVLPGYTSTVSQQCYEYEEIQYISVPSSTTRGAILARWAYGSTAAMNRASKTMASYHKYFHGHMKIALRIFGAANKVGELTMAWVPDINAEYSIKDAQLYGNYHTVTMNTQAGGAIVFGNADTEFRPREVNANTPMTPGVILMATQPPENALGAENTAVSLQILACLEKDAGFTFVQAGALVDDTRTFVANTTDLSLNLGDVVGRENGSLYMIADGQCYYRDSTQRTLVPAYIGDDGFDFGYGYSDNSFRYYGGTVTLDEKIQGTQTNLSQNGTSGFRAAALHGHIRSGMTAREQYLDAGESPLIVTKDGAIGELNQTYQYATLGQINVPPGDDSVAYWVNNGGAVYSHAVVVGPSGPGTFLENYGVTYNIQAITGPNPCTNDVRGLSRFTLADTRSPLFGVSPDIETPFSANGRHPWEYALISAIKTLVGGTVNENVKCAILVENFPVGELLLDIDKDQLFVRAVEPHSYTELDPSTVVLTNFQKVGLTTLPSPITPAAFRSLYVPGAGGTVTRGRKNVPFVGHEAAVSGAMLAGLIASDVAQTAGGLIGSGITSKKNREFAAEQAELARKFAAEQNALDRRFTAFNTMAARRLADELTRAGYKTELAKTALVNKGKKEQIAMTNANLATTANSTHLAGNSNQDHRENFPEVRNPALLGSKDPSVNEAVNLDVLLPEKPEPDMPEVFNPALLGSKNPNVNEAINLNVKMPKPLLPEVYNPALLGSKNAKVNEAINLNVTVPPMPDHTDMEDLYPTRGEAEPKTVVEPAVSSTESEAPSKTPLEAVPEEPAVDMRPAPEGQESDTPEVPQATAPTNWTSPESTDTWGTPNVQGSGSALTVVDDNPNVNDYPVRK